MSTSHPAQPLQDARATGPQPPAGAPERLTDLGEAMRAALDGPYHPQRDRVRQDLDPREVLRDPAMTTEQARAWTSETLARLAARGYGRAGFPHEHGGTGDLAASVVGFEMMAHTDLSLTVKSGVHFGLFGGAVANLGTEWHLTELVPRVLSLELPGCFAMTEVGHGSDVQSLETTLTHDPGTDELVVHTPSPTATKTYIGGAARDARMAVVFGQLVVGGQSHGIHAVVVPLRDEDGTVLPGVTTGDNGAKGGLPGVDNGTLAFDRVRVPRRMLLDRHGGIDDAGRYTSSIEGDNRRFFTMLGTLVRGRVCVAGGAGVAARKALSIATRYALQRRQFRATGYDGEVLLLDYLAHQRKLLPAIATAYAFGFAQNELTLTLQRVQGGGGEPDLTAQRELETRAAGMKAVTTRWANDTIQLCREACGGAGYLAENGLTQLRGDADVFATFEGDNTVLLQLVAKGLLTNYSETFGELDMLGMVQFAARSFGGAVIERTAARPLIERIVSAAQRGEERPLLDRAWHVTMFEDRERHVLETLAQRMRNARKARGEDAFAAFNTTQDHVLLAARTHVDRVVLEAFVAGIDACADPAAREVLERLCDLYALSSLEADSGWFQAHNRMSAARAKAVTAQVNQLCADLRPHALALVEGLGVPETWLGSAMLTPRQA